ncbi:zinc-dependent metalloprotease [Mucisphaera calidilacus]|uniref:DUF5117 domain-containing protein n=1 Tax=Mucisphaera calidilacus TaxID=2527982 RepID=A0A518BVE8_9BACT|nr:zinc-dependent metalloprotease [Mucisphaera calidilacus]QDU70949.1 hypothetical protein Pan265_07930 [Mucisphaera calidilacus]
MLTFRPLGLFLVAAVLLFAPLSVAADEAETKASTPKPAYPEFKKVVEGLEEIPGLMTIYRASGDDPTQDHTKLLCRIPRSLIGEDLLFATSISRGQYAGFMWSDWLVRWEIVGKHVKLVAPNVEYVQSPGSPVNNAIERTYRPSFLVALPIVTMAGGDPVVDLGGLVFSKISRPPTAAGTGSPNRKLSVVRKVKNFPENVLIDIDLAMSSTYGGESVGVAYAFRKLPAESSYTPRPADERVGYFVTLRRDWSTSYSERETRVRYANRWKLEKQDPSLELSPPKEPIVFIIEDSVPIRWRRWIRAGIEEWNKAFEEIGYVDAIIVQQQTASNEFADIDPEDARYNFIRWVVTGRAFARGPSVADPRTGQILDADIVFDDSMIRWFTAEFDQLGPSSLSSVRGPGYEHHEAMLDLAAGHGGLDERAAETWTRGHVGHESHECASCSIAHGLAQQMAMGLIAAKVVTPTGKEVPERFLGEVIKQITTHEVGHTLGLRHNFRASAWLTLDQIRERRDGSDEALSASVMDYNPIMYFKGDSFEEVRHFVTPVIGPYDYWAIEYGYGDPAPGQSANDFLASVAAQSTKPEHAYATDEDTYYIFSPDPLTNRWDLSSDLDGWLTTRGELVSELMDELSTWGADRDEPRYFLRQMFSALLSEMTRPGYYLARIPGGQYFSRSRATDPDARAALTLVEPEKMRAAVDRLGETVLSPDYFAFDPKLLNNLARSRWVEDFSRTDPVEYPIHTYITRVQKSVLYDMLGMPGLQRLYDNEIKTTAEDKYTLAEHLQKLNSIVWPELEEVPAGPYTDAEPMIPAIRRNLQSVYLKRLMTYVSVDLTYADLSPDVQRMVRYSLRETGEKIGAVLDAHGKDLDFATKAHLTETRSQIERVLEAQFTAK